MLPFTGAARATRAAKATLAALDKSQATIEFKPDGTILTANGNFLAAMGYALEEIRGRHHSLFVDAATRDSADYRAFWASLARGEYHAAEFRRVGKGGREVWIQATYNPVRNRAGKVFKVVKFATDITASRRSAATTASIVSPMRSPDIVSPLRDRPVNANVAICVLRCRSWGSLHRYCSSAFCLLTFGRTKVLPYDRVGFNSWLLTFNF
jgi:PAS domain S-box-containing protein